VTRSFRSFSGITTSRTEIVVYLSCFVLSFFFLCQKGETLLLQTYLSRSNTVVSKAIQWKDISLPEDWILEGAAPPEIPPPPQPNIQIKNITQYTNGYIYIYIYIYIYLSSKN